MADAISSDGPLQLISIDDNGKCLLQEPALEVLRGIRGRLAVVGVAGLYRTGKSFLLNRLLGMQNGFDIGPTVNPCTKGLWIWGKPVELAPDYHCIFLDTEGLGSTQRTASCDLQIFSLCILLSSFFIYNSMGAIDEQAIDDLHVVLHVAQHIHAKSRREHEDQNKADLAHYLPSFLWVLRDFHLRLESEGGANITCREYLESALRPLPGQEDKNKLREVLKDLFGDRDCVTLVRPAVDEEDLRHLHRLPYESLRPQFRSQLEDFVKRVYDGLQPKVIEGSCLNGAMLAGLAEEYCNAINKSTVPTIQSAWCSVVQQQLRASLKEAISSYQVWVAETTAKHLPMSDDRLHDLHRLAKADAIKVFERPRFDEAIPKFQEYRSELTSRLKMLYEQAKAENVRASRRQCEEVAADLYDTQIASKLNVSGSYQDVESLMQDWEHVRTAYMLRTAGPAQGEVLSTWLFQRMAESVRTLSVELRNAVDERMDALEQKLSAVQERANPETAACRMTEWLTLPSGIAPYARRVADHGRRYREAASSLARDVHELILTRAGSTSWGSRSPRSTQQSAAVGGA